MKQMTNYPIVDDEDYPEDKLKWNYIQYAWIDTPCQCVKGEGWHVSVLEHDYGEAVKYCGHCCTIYTLVFLDDE